MSKKRKGDKSPNKIKVTPPKSRDLLHLQEITHGTGAGYHRSPKDYDRKQSRKEEHHASKDYDNE